MSAERTFGNFIKLAVRGASHAKKMTFALANMPAGVRVDEDELAAFMERRAPGRNKLSTARNEPDVVTFTGGLRNGVTTGETLCGEIVSVDMRPHDYGEERTVPRPGHADFGQWVETGRIPTGGGKNSGRLTAPLCAVGGVCLQFLYERGITVKTYAESIRGKKRKSTMVREIANARDEGDSVGGTIVCVIEGVPAGLGGALFEGLESEISAAMFAIPGVKGIEFGEAFRGTLMNGSQYNDAFVMEDGEVKTETNIQGGIMGGRTNGMPIWFRVAMRPTPTVFKEQQSVDLKTMTPATIAMKGRHDPCIVVRALPVVEAQAAFAITDAILADEATRPRICLTLTGRTIDDCLAQYNSQRYFTDMVELRADLLDREERENLYRLMDKIPVPKILTFRRKCDGGAFDGDESVRTEYFAKQLLIAATFLHVSGQTYFACVDFESDFRNEALEKLAHEAGVKIIRSRHEFTGTVPDIAAACRELRGDTDEIPKIAFMPKSAADVERLFEETKNFTEFPHIVCAMGELGLPSRVLAVRTHSLLTYASVGGLGKIGHVTPLDLVRKYRLKSVSPQARVVYVPAEKVEETNFRFSDEDEDAVALPQEVKQ